MSDNPRRAHVTVTLGRAGRVVKRAGELSDEGNRNGGSIAGSKRSIKDRLGGKSENRGETYDKRQRGESTSSSIDMCLGKDDLRFKLMQKDTGRESQNSESPRNVDLRDKLLSKKSRPSSAGMTMRRPESAASTRHPVLDPRVAGMTRHSVLEPRDTSMLRRLPPSRNPSELSAVGPPRSYSSYTAENLRRRSPENLRRGSPEVLRRRSPEVLRRRSPEVLRRRSPEVLRRRSPEILRRHSPEGLRRRSPERLFPPTAARGLSPPRSREELQRRPLIRSYDGAGGRSTSYVGTTPAGAVRSPYLTQTLVPAPTIKSVVPVSHYPQASGILQKIPSSVDLPHTVDSLLQSLGLEKYAIYFKAEEVDMNALRQLGDSDLKDLGIPMGPRKKILQAVMPRTRRQL